MPTTYAHDRFGREVYEQLPANLKKIIRENKKLYLIGLHGPDIFFYYHPFSKNRVSDYGTFLHEQTASVLLDDEVKKYQQSPSEAMEAYLLALPAITFSIRRVIRISEICGSHWNFPYKD